MMIVEKNRHIILPDNVRLMADVYRPDNNVPVPALIAFTAFGKEVQAIGLKRKPLTLGMCLDDLSLEVGGIEFFVNNGYAVVVTNPRGIGNCEGIWHGLYSLQDQQDCASVVEWAALAPWCTGKVGMIGTGTAGRIQPLTASHQPPHLKAIMPVDLIDDFFRENYPGGIFSNYYLPFTSTIPMVSAISDAERMLPKEELLRQMAACLKRPEIAEEPYLYRMLETVPPRHFPQLVDFALNDKDGPFWAERSQKGKNKDITIPMYAVTWCYEFGRSVQAAINAFSDSSCKAPRKLMFLGHASKRQFPFHQANKEVLRWYDYWLKDIDNGIMEEPPVRLYVMGEERYRAEESWPVKGCNFEKLYLTQGGLSFKGPQGEPDRLYHEPPIFKSQFSGQIPALKYSTGTLLEDLELTGPVSITLYSEIDQRDGNFHAKIWDASPDGTRILLATGCVRAACRGVISDGLYGESPENQLDHPTPVEPGRIYEYHFALNPVCNVFKKGHEIHLEIKATDPQSYSFTDCTTLPRLFSSGHTSGPLPSTLFTHYRIYHDERYPSHITVPLVKQSAGKWLE
ncbi:MAG: CocE/NonD family hydrolase [Anaerolineaceae bacterium]|nr:CocE/NonD family hydrolase [Anaerolineaceae bacterium]